MWAILISALAVAGTVANFLYTQWATDRRDVAKWRREELQKLTSNLLQLSTSRQSELGDVYEAYESRHRDLPNRKVSTSEKVWQMELIVEQIRLLDDNMAAAAAAIWKAHQAAENEYAASEQTDTVSELKMLAVSGLNDLHHTLVDGFRVATGLPKRSIAHKGQPRLK